MKVSNSINLEEFLGFFPILDLPIALTDEVVPQISKVNKVFPEVAIATFLSKWEDDMDEFSEFLPCCQLPPQDNFYSFVYWKAVLMAYEFVLVTLDKKGNFIQKKVIAGTISNGSTIKQSAARIEDDLSIHIVVGEKKVDDHQYDPTNSQSYYMEILPNGQMISSQEDDKLWQEKNSNKEN